MSEVIDSSSDSQPSARSPSAMALDVSAASYESGRRALQLAVGGGGSIQEMASLLAQEAEEHENSSSLDPTGGAHDKPVRCDHHTALGVAASAGHVDAVERLLEAGADPNAPVHEVGISALEAAAAQGQLIVVQKLLGTGAHPDHCGGERSESTPLIAAAEAGHVEICKALLQNGADVSISKRYFDNISVNYVTSSAIEAAGETSSTTLLELFLGRVEDTAKEFDPDDLNNAVAEGRQKDSRRLLDTREFLDRARTSINNALVKAAATSNMLVLQRLLDAGADITAEAGRAGNAIAAAASRGHLEAVNKLLQAGSDQGNLPAAAVTAALQSAVDVGNMALIELLTQAGGDATKIDIRKLAAAGNLDVLTFVLHSGALVDVDPGLQDLYHWSRAKELSDFTALQLAAYHGHQAVVELLLAKGADVNESIRHASDENETDLDGATAVHLAAVGGHLAVVKLLIDADADVNAPCRYADTALQAAVRAGDTTMVEVLLAAGAVVDVDVFGHKTALSVAAEVKNPDLVARLLSIMPLHDARRAATLALEKAVENHSTDIVRQLLQLHPDVNLHSKRYFEVEDLSLLQRAAADGNLEILEVLLSEGADVNSNPSGGWKQTALQNASERGDLAAVKLLLAAGAEVNATGATASPLLLAIRGGHVQVFEYLLSAGADIHATAYWGQTMLEAADYSGDADIQDRVRAALDSQPPPPIDQPLDRGTDPHCEACRKTSLVDLFWELGNETVLHPSLTALRASAAAGCPFCCFVSKRLAITSISIPQPSPVSFSKRPVSPPTMRCIVHEPFPPNGEWRNGLRIEIEFPVVVPFSGEISSRAALPLLKQWIQIGCWTLMWE
ncbi:hypothetical protein INS49_007041 [Diaporthe citri]|uniref:uncharacterized protein n=1 Tax=Diaporthe citri TaxID=83186 RepID=UPI001C7ED698|nr:uncharacterized protein INS49_007041 [Diaporthe citri]KAG6365430.1 hypothetical protein INS49_007041 [Diaporthe citri]